MPFDFLTNLEFWKYLSIPVVAGLVGWSTNWVAIKMMFNPVDPIGKPPYLGWQGILPAKAAKMGAITADTTLAKLGSLSDVFQAMDPQKMTSHVLQSIEPRIEAYVDWIMLEENPRMWEKVPGMIKRMVYRVVRQELPEAVELMMIDIGENIEDMVNIRDVVVKKLVKEKQLVNKIFQECGKVEFEFIVKSGLYYGFCFGLIQMALWYFFPIWWMLPLFGILVGYLTNWIAIRIIFQPLYPIKIGPLTFHGLFLSRQKEVSDIWCGIVSREIITLPNIVEEMLSGSKSENTQTVIQRHIRDIVDKTIGIARPLVEFTMGVNQLSHIETLASEKALFVTADSFDDPEFSLDRANVVKLQMQERMEALSSEEFQHLLRPAFQEDELKLILLGAFLGLLAGLGQLFLVFGGIS